ADPALRLIQPERLGERRVLCKPGAEARHVARPKGHRAAAGVAVARVGEANEPLALARLEQLHERREALLPRLLANSDLLDHLRLSPRCCDHGTSVRGKPSRVCVVALAKWRCESTIRSRASTGRG